MPSTIYNEGRVVGYSAYEVYVRHAVSEGMEPVSEKEWLSSTLTDGSSLLLQLTPNQLDRTGHTLGSAGGHIIDIPLPETDTFMLTTVEPDDWKTRWDRYYTLNGNVYILVSSFPVPIWESGKYYIGTAPTWVEDKYYELSDDHYELLTSRPVTWGYRWMYYYESDDGGQTFKPVVGSSYTPIDNQPADWSINWDTYFERTGTSPDYTYVLATNWRPNMYYRKIETHITAANTIVASFFMGEGYYENTDDFWATHVKSYGRLLKNDVALDSETYIDAKDTNCLGPGEWQNELRNYANIVDGDVIVSGTWTPEQDPNTQPPNDFVPDLSDTASPTIVRLYIKEALTETINILLTGFMLKSILKGMTNLTDGSIDTNYPEDGDFLGPSTFPWGNKIIFSFPTAAISALLTGYSRTRDNFVLQTSEPADFISAYYKYYEIQPDGYILTINEPQYWSNRYKRYYTKSGNTYTPITSSTAPTWVQNTYYAKVRNGLVSLDGITDTSSLQWEQRKYYTRTGDNYPITVSRAPTIDIDTTLGQYYQSNYSESPVDFTVNGTNLYDNNVLTVYSRFDILPPSLYGTLVQDTGEHKMYPIDTVAPGTVKIFEDDDAKDRANAVNHLSGNIGMYRDSDYIIHQTIPTGPNDSTDPISDTYVTELPADRLGGQRPYGAENVSGKKSAISISLQDTLGKMLPRTGIHPPAFDNNVVFKLQGLQLVAVTTEPSDWETSYNSYYWDSLHWWQGDGTTTTFTFAGTIPEQLKGVAVDDYIKTEGVDWTYSNGVLTFQTAPAYDTTITTYVAPPATFETMNPLTTIGNEKFIERKGTLHWDDLLFALANNKAIDLFNNDYFLTRFAEILSDKLIAGSGIGIDSATSIQPSSTSEIKLKLSPRRTVANNPNTAGGITMSSAGGNDTQLYIKVNTGESTQIVQDAVEVKFNPTQGTGINVTQDSNGIKITNTMPSYENSAWTDITNFTPYNNEFDTGKSFRAVLASTSTASSDIRDCMHVKYSKSSDNSTLSIDIDFEKTVSGSKYVLGHNGFGFKTWINKSTGVIDNPPDPSHDEQSGFDLFSTGFAFVHSYSQLAPRQHAVIVGIKLGSEFNSFRNSGYTFTDVSDNFSGIWNIKNLLNAPDNRASWPARCELRANSDLYSGDTWPSGVITTAQDWDLVVVGLSYADGYNTQITHYNGYGGEVGTEQSRESNHINLHVSGVFTKP